MQVKNSQSLTVDGIYIQTGYNKRAAELGTGMTHTASGKLTIHGQVVFWD
jgi:hypothetical protein